jgi:hypothetical protein
MHSETRTPRLLFSVVEAFTGALDSGFFVVNPEEADIKAFEDAVEEAPRSSKNQREAVAKLYAETLIVAQHYISDCGRYVVHPVPENKPSGAYPWENLIIKNDTFKTPQNTCAQWVEFCIRNYWLSGYSGMQQNIKYY